MTKIDVEKSKKAGDYIRYLSLFSIENAKSGHPGLPLGCADIGVLLYRYILRYNTAEQIWINRDRFILSAGHGSMFLYSLLHCAGYKIRLSDLANFRQLDSITPGHPEYDPELGIETTTGPLAQGFANSVGAAIEGKMLAAKFNREKFPIFDYNVYTLMGDGCNMEGLSYEAGSLAGHLGLDNLIAIYDSNKISIDGSTDITFTEDVGKRYEAFGWFVEYCDACEVEDMLQKFNKLKSLKGKPKILIVKTTIGFGLNKSKGTAKIHGSAAGIDEIVYFIQNSRVKRLFEKNYGNDIVENFDKLKELCLKNISEKTLPVESKEDTAFIQESNTENKIVYDAWKKMMEDYQKIYPSEFKELSRYQTSQVPTTLKEKLLHYKEEKADATRNISGRVLGICADEIPQIVGGSADLVESTKATVKSSKYITRDDFSGRNIAFGVREHSMGSICNGLALSGMLLPFSSTFFTFFDYMKPSVRLSAIMKIKHLFIFTHDSIYVGEDGPTHQPIEHLNALRLIPGIYTFRPANDAETAFSYLYYFDEMKGPMALICSRQNMPDSAYKFDKDRKKYYGDFKKGAYIIYETDKDTKPGIILSASGSEVGLAIDCAKLIEERNKSNVRVVSIPCLELFNESGKNYKDSILGNGDVPLVFIETASHRGVSLFYDKAMTLIDIEQFGYSGPGNKVAAKLGFTPDGIYDKIKDLLK